MAVTEQSFPRKHDPQTHDSGSIRDFSHARKGKWPLSRVFSKKAVLPFSRGKNRISQGVENRGSLISVPLALRVVTYYILKRNHL